LSYSFGIDLPRGVRELAYDFLFAFDAIQPKLLSELTKQIGGNLFV